MSHLSEANCQARLSHSKQLPKNIHLPYMMLQHHFVHGRKHSYSGRTEKPTELKCGPMPNVMAALPNIGGVLCSTPQSLADTQYWSAV